MKKVLSMIAALLLCVGTQAQIVSSRSAIVKTEKQASSTQWFLRAGLNIMNFSGDGAEGADSNIGYNATFGYQKPLGSTGAVSYTNLRDHETRHDVVCRHLLEK